MKIKYIVFIGERFYWDSQTMMSSIYTIEKDGSYSRYDWGKLMCDVQDNPEICFRFRYATKKELKYFENKLNESHIKWGKQKDMKSNVYDITDDLIKTIKNEFGSDVYITGEE